MTTLLLYLVTVLVWGTSWYAIKLQVGTVPTEVSVTYRFALAAVIAFGWCLFRGQRLRLDARQQAMVMALGLMLFCINLTLIYYATQTLTSGLVSVVFSTITVMNILNGRLVLGRSSTGAVWVGALMGLAGLATIFRHDLIGIAAGRNGGAALGLVYCLVGTFVASLGNVWAVQVRAAGVSVEQSNAWGMAYGATALFLFALIKGDNLALTPTLPYLGGLAYLAVFASVVGFTTYLTLLHRIGPDRAGYCSVAFPVVALAVSALYESFQVTWETVVGGLIVLAGNVLVLRRTGS